MRKQRNSKQQSYMKNKMPRKGKGSPRSKASTKDEELTKEAVANSTNDPAWYASDPAILRDAASFPFSYSTGATATHDRTLYSGSEIPPFSSIPGICTLRITPNTGFNLRATDPINVAAQSVYSFVRHANSGHQNYDAPDLMLYILGMANAYSYLVWCQRLYGYALTYDQRNRYIPNELIRLNNVDPDDVRDNLANFRFWINTLIAKMASFAVPATFSIFSRMSFMYSDYYIEGTSIKEQLYQFAPEGFYKFGLDSQSKGKLIWVPFNYGTLMTVNDIMTYGNTLFGSIWDEEDFGIMSGDILKAYGDRIIKLSSIPEAYSLAPKFDPMVLTQMKNSLMLRSKGSDITQANNLIVQVLTPDVFTTSDTYWGSSRNLIEGIVAQANTFQTTLLKDWKSLTVDTDDPTPDVVMEATRLMWAYDAYLGEMRLGTEFVSHVVLTYEVGSDYIYSALNVCEQATIADVKGFFESSEVYKHFHYVPRIYWYIHGSSYNKVIEWFDLDNYTILDNTDLAKLHQAAVINMYAVPSVGKIQ